MREFVLLSAMVCYLAVPTSGLTILFDFETDAEVRQWSVRSAEQDTLVGSMRFATSGKWSAVFRSPRWRPGMAEWPALEAKPPVQDWSAAEALLIDLTNPTDAPLTLKVFITDAKTPVRRGMSKVFSLAPRSSHRAVIALSGLPKHIDRTSIALLHFFTTRPADDYVIHIDNVALLAKGESPPPYPDAYVRDLVSLIMAPDLIAKAKADLDRAAERIEQLIPTTSVVGARFAKQVRLERVALEKAELACQAGRLSLGEAKEIQSQISRKTGARLESLARLARRWMRQGNGAGPIVGYATSMEKILPRGDVSKVRIVRSQSLSLARNETEAFQVVVIPLRDVQKGVRVEVDDLVSETGARLSSKSVDVRVVGYVKTARPCYRVEHVGWWPDPLLDFITAVDVALGDAQAFWVRLRAPKDAPAGDYRGKIRVRSADRTLFECRLNVRVYGFTMPDRSPLPTAISVYIPYVQRFAGDRWDALRPVWADYLADYYIDYDHLYRAGPPDWDILKRLHKQGRLVSFNLRTLSHHAFPAELAGRSFEEALKKLIGEVGAIYRRAEREGIADKAYFYGFDERGKKYFPILQRICAGVKKALPDLKLMTTTYEHSYGLGSVVKDMDAWVPLTPRYDPLKAAKARKRGKEVWWYICCGPAHPYANWFVEYPAIEARLLMGMMTAKYRPDGFLYYAITRWPNNSKPIETGPFTTWNPASFRTYNGDGSLLCPGPGGRPLATIRLENFRDGLEDYAYARILEATVADRRAAGRTQSGKADAAWLGQAEALLTVPEKLVEDLRRFTHDPAVLYDYRDKIAQAIMSAGVPPADPWQQ